MFFGYAEMGYFEGKTMVRPRSKCTMSNEALFQQYLFSLFSRRELPMPHPFFRIALAALALPPPSEPPL
jgi:hypothetical protein